MFIQQIYTNCLAHAAYYIESENEAMVIDPLRNPEPYIDLAIERGAVIKYVAETHFHADFVSGHLDLANQTGATIVFGPGATPGYRAYIAEDGEILHVGKLKLKVLHTPGHTIESICILLIDEEGKDYAVFTGDTLFVGDVGRPDLMSGNLSKEELAAMLYDSLETKIKTLADDVIVYPGHGAGSACGKNIGTESFSTIGAQKKFNYALGFSGKAAFISAVTSDLPVIPGYFFTDAGINKTGSSPYGEVLAKSNVPLSADQLLDLQRTGAIVLDARGPVAFAKAFIPGAINIGLNGDFAVWVGSFIAPDARIVLVTDAGKETEAIERLARIGYDHVQGYLQGGMDTWLNAGRACDDIPVYNGAMVELMMEAKDEYNLLDVRNRKEVAHNRLVGSRHIPLNQLKAHMDQLDKSRKWLIYCAGGYRSMIAASFLKANGFRFASSVEGGINAVLTVAPTLVAIDLEEQP